MRSLAFALLPFVALLGPACGDDTKAPADTGTPDSAVATDVQVTDSAATDSAVTSPTDAAADVDDATPDATPDAADSALEVEVTPPCSERPNPFVYPDESVAWNEYDIATEVAALSPPNHRGQDVIVAAGEPQVLVGKFAYGFVDKDMKKEDVAIWMQREPPCGDWEWMGDVRTSDDGQYGTTYGIEDDGGRAFFTIPEDKRFPVGRFPVRMVLKGDLTTAAFDLIVVERGTQAIVTDIDGTLTTGDEELILELILKVFNEEYEQLMIPDADKMVAAWARKGYLVVYMTGRPDPLRPMTERWVEPRFVPGPLHLTDTNGQAVPNDEGVGAYKTEFLAHLKAQGLDIVAAYGNATTDIFAYEQAALPKAHTYIYGTHRGERETQPIEGSYTNHLPIVEAFPDATKRAPPAFGWW